MTESASGQLHIYTGNGKGKSTGAMGLALRAAGRGRQVFIGQFIKGRETGEMLAFEKFANVTFRQFGSGKWVFHKSSDQIPEQEKQLAAEGLAKITGIASSGEYDLVVCDEILGAIKSGLVRVEQAVALVKSKAENCELVFTGRNAPQELVDLAGLVSEINPLKHYFDDGVPAREGIEF